MTTEADLARWLMLKLLARVLRRIRDRGFPHVWREEGGPAKGAVGPRIAVGSTVVGSPDAQEDRR